ncbi:MAG: hypothetical protein HGA75_17300, partial [Thiobacillus sp.]|nr:hypothetical protein [Thiobacillus sp.]
EAAHLVKWYAQEHVLLCLRPAFFIAGAIGVFVSQAAVMKVFGLGGGQGAQAVGIELTGLYARADGRGFATLRTPRGPLSGIAGEEILPGVRLRQVGNDHVILMIDGSERRLELLVTPPATLNLTSPAQP